MRGAWLLLVAAACSSSAAGYPPFACSDDDLSGLAPSGAISVGPSTDVIGLCDGWVVLGDRLANQLVRVHPGRAPVAVQLESQPGDLELDATHGLVWAAMWPATYLERVDLRDGLVKRVDLSGGARSVTHGAAGRVMAAIARDEYDADVQLVDALGGVGARIAGPFENQLALDRAHDVVFGGQRGLSPSTLSRYTFDAAADTLSLAQRLPDECDNGGDLALSADGAHLAFACGAGNQAIYTISDFAAADLMTVHGVFDTGAYPAGAAWSPDGRRFAATNTNDLMIFDSTTHAVTQKLTTDHGDCDYGGLAHVAFSGGGRIAWAYTDCGIDRDSGKLHWLLLQ